MVKIDGLDDWETSIQAANRLNVPYHTLNRAQKRGFVPAVNRWGRWLTPISIFDMFVEKNQLASYHKKRRSESDWIVLKANWSDNQSSAESTASESPSPAP